MQFIVQFLKTLAVALAALVCVAGLVAAYGACQASIQPSTVDAAGAVRVGFLGTLMFGVLPVAAFGTPAYVWLSRHGRVNWASVLGLVLVPTIVLAFLDIELALLGAICGLVVASATHIICSRWLSPYNSFKPTPLRGAA